MRILIVTGIFPPDIGGPATYVPCMAAGLADLGYWPTVLTLADGGGNDADRYAFRVVRLPRRLFKPWRWLRAVVEIIRLGRDADVLFVNGLALEAALANTLLRKRMVQKVVADLAWERAASWGWIVDGFEDFQRKRYGLKVQVLKVVRAWWTRQADRVIVPSRHLAEWVQQWGVPAAKITVIGNAVELPGSIGPTTVSLQTPIKIVTVGRLIPGTHVDRLLRAVASLDSVGLVVIGDGPERKRLESLGAHLGILDRVYFAGARSRMETLAIMAACDMFVLNSSHEGFPHVVLEAMGLGLPVVATAAGGIPEIVSDRENGRLIPPLNNEALRTAISELITTPSERRRLAHGAKRTIERFSFQRMVDESAQLLVNRIPGSLKSGR
ncbi:MAG TPA: glycosyltransferase family 4 protein [Nitrospiraceae bacterium]|nr:glycosyltransferase family 4 protein [Nitrospiraceae bacterium]